MTMRPWRTIVGYGEHPTMPWPMHSVPVEEMPPGWQPPLDDFDTREMEMTTLKVTPDQQQAAQIEVNALRSAGLTPEPLVVAIAEASDPVNSPPHYKRGNVELIDITELCSFNRGNIIKYVFRAGEKDAVTELQDLKKARWYLDREILHAELKQEEADGE